MSWPVSSPPPTERQGPSTTSTPAKPAARPATRRGVGRSSGSMNVATTSVSSGVVAFQMPASTEEMRVSPSARSRKGIEGGEQHERTERHPAEGDVDRRERVHRDFDREEARAPDQG